MELIAFPKWIKLNFQNSYKI